MNAENGPQELQLFATLTSYCVWQKPYRIYTLLKCRWSKEDIGGFRFGYLPSKTARHTVLYGSGADDNFRTPFIKRWPARKPNLECLFQTCHITPIDLQVRQELLGGVCRGIPNHFRGNACYLTDSGKRTRRPLPGGLTSDHKQHHNLVM